MNIKPKTTASRSDEPHRRDELRESRWPRAFLMPLFWICTGVALGFLIKSQRENSSEPPALLRSAQPVVQNTGGSSKPLPANTAGQPIFSTLERLRGMFGTDSRINIAEALLLISELQPADFPHALDLLRDMPEGERRPLFEVLAVRWADADPFNALSPAQRDRGNQEWRERLGAAAGAALAARAPEAALAQIRNMSNPMQRNDAARWILPALAKTNPRRACEFVEALGLRNHSLYGEVAREFGRAAPHEAIAWAESLGSGRLKQQALEFAWRGWIDSNPADAAAALQKQELKLNDSLYAVLAQSWSRTDLMAAAIWAGSLREEQRRAALRFLEPDLDQLGADGAAKLLETVKSPVIRQKIAEKMGRQMAMSDVQTALSWAENLGDEQARRSARNVVLHEWASSNPAEAVRHITALPGSDDRMDLLGHAFSTWSQLEPEASFKHGQTLQDSKMRDVATVTAIEAVRQDNPDKALEWFQAIQTPEYKNHLAGELIQNLARQDPAAAIKVASELPQDAQVSAYYGLMRGWSFDQPQEAGNFVNQLPPGPARDSAVKAYVSVIDGMNAGAATQWAYTIEEPKERMETTISVFARWLRTDRAAAAQWAEQTPVPEGFRPFIDRLLNEQEYAEFPR